MGRTASHPQPARQLAPYRFPQQYRNRIPYLAHRFAPCAFDDEVVGEGLDSFCLAHRKIADAAVRVADHVFSAGNAVTARLDGFCWPVDVAAGVAGVGARAVVEDVIVNAVLGLWIGDALQRVPDSAPRQLLRLEHAVPVLQAGNLFLQKLAYRCALRFRHMMTFPIFARNVHLPKQPVFGMRFCGERPVHAQIGSRAHDHNPFPRLRDTVVCRVD